MKPLKRNTVLSLWLLVIVVCSAYTALRFSTGVAIESNILGLMPHEEGERWQPKLSDDSVLQRGFVILIGHPQAEKSLSVANGLVESLKQQSGITMDETGDLPATLAATMHPYRHQLLSPSKRQQIKEKDTSTLAMELYASLYSPLQEPRLYNFADDPFNLGGSWLGALFPDASHTIPGPLPSINADGITWYLLRGNLGGSSFNLSVQEGIAAALTNVTHDSGVRVLTSGLVFHAAEATRISQTEIATMGTGSLLGILLLVILALRSTAALLAIGLTLLTSTLAALTITLAVFDSVHMITVVFGSTLLGLAVSYIFHFVVKYRRMGDAMAAWLLLRQGLLFSLAASCLAYLVQLVSPFPGLRQFAVFVPAGLIGAFISVWVLAHCYREKPEIRVNRVPRLYIRCVEPLYLRLGTLPKLLPLALLLVTAGLTIYLVEKGFNDDIRSLNTSSSQLMDSERQIQRLLGGIDVQRYWVAQGADTQQVLERSEMVVAKLAEANGGRAAAMSASQLVPSLRQQREDFSLVADKLYGPEGAIEKFCSMAGSDCSAWEGFPGKFSDGLVPEAIPTAIANHFPPLMLGDEHHGVLLPYRDIKLPADTLSSLIHIDGVYFVDQVERISSILAGFRNEVTHMFALFLMILAIGSFAAYRGKGLLLMTCIVFSLAVALGASVREGITLFHILALLLVLGFSVDTAIFYLELGFTADTWTASTLSTSTELLAFGLLAFSQIPLLHYFGSVVFTGLMCSWLLTPAIYLLAARRTPHQSTRSTSDRNN